WIAGRRYRGRVQAVPAGRGRRRLAAADRRHRRRPHRHQQQPADPGAQSRPGTAGDSRASRSGRPVQERLPADAKSVQQHAAAVSELVREYDCQ
ncbi:unnamed protein product, partial [Didymodactylos carnosus]